MKTVPNFTPGDRVRVMQTDAMVAAGYANKHGVLIAVWSEPDGIARSKSVCRVQLADKAVTLPASSLMKV